MEEGRTENDRDVKEEYAYTDRHARMAIYDRRWRDFDDDYNYRYDPYRYGYNYGYYYNPYYYPSPVYISGINFSNPKNTVPRMTNLGSYNYSSMEVVNPKAGTTKWIRSGRQYNTRNNSDNFIRRIITPSDIRTNSSSNNNNTRTYSPSQNVRSGSSSNNSGTPVSRPKRGG
jgi:hypothetical protein